MARPNIATPDTTMPEGTYYVGDLCYVFDDDSWTEICDLQFASIQHCLDGAFVLKDGTRFANVSTHYGDGVYADQDGYTYGVDSGSIGCVLWSVVEKYRRYDDAHLLSMARKVEFTKPFQINGTPDGMINIGHIDIYTGFEDEVEGEDEDEDEK
jgi:hypothetical protein